MNFRNEIMNAAVSFQGLAIGRATVRIKRGPGVHRLNSVPGVIQVGGAFDVDEFLRRTGCGGGVGSDGFSTPYTANSFAGILDQLGVPADQQPGAELDQELSAFLLQQERQRPQPSRVD